MGKSTASIPLATTVNENLNPDRMRWPLVFPPMFLLLTQGLARVSHRKELGLGSFSKYLYDDHAGEGVVAYIIE